MRNGIVAATILGVAFVIGLTVLATTWRGNVQLAQTLKVTGSAKMDLVSDLGLLRYSVQGEGASAEAAWRELQRQLPTVQQFLAARGIVADHVETFPVNAWSIDEYDQHGQRTGRVLRHVAEQSFLIQHGDVHLIKQLSLDLGGMVTEGVSLRNGMPEYLFTGLGEVKDTVQALAAEDAMRRAKRVAEAAGARLGPIRDARMGVLQVTPRHSTQVSDWGINDNSSIEKQITAVVHASFAIR